MSQVAIDAHQHFWTVGESGHDWAAAPDTSRLARGFEPSDLDPHRRAAGVDATIVVQSANNVRDTEQLLAVAARTAWVAGVVGWVSLVDPSERARAIERFRADRRFCGVRHLTNLEPDDWISQPAVEVGLRDLAQRGITFDAVPETPDALSRTIAIAKRLPELRIVLDHLARPPIIDSGWDPWARLISEAASCPNVAIKASVGLDVLRRWPRWESAELRPYLAHTVDAFGADRVIMATNWPVVLLTADYDAAWQQMRTLLADASEGERAAMLGGNAAAWYGLRGRA